MNIVHQKCYHPLLRQKAAHTLHSEKRHTENRQQSIIQYKRKYRQLSINNGCVHKTFRHCSLSTVHEAFNKELSRVYVDMATVSIARTPGTHVRRQGQARNQGGGVRLVRTTLVTRSRWFAWSVFLICIPQARLLQFFFIV